MLTMINDYISKNLKKARYKLLKDGTYFAEISGIRGVWANAKSLEDCRRELAESLAGWLLLKIRMGQKVPGFSFRLPSLRKVNA